MKSGPGLAHGLEAKLTPLIEMNELSDNSLLALGPREGGCCLVDFLPCHIDFVLLSLIRFLNLSAFVLKICRVSLSFF